MLYLGIDLGTTFSLVSHVNDHGQPTLFPDFHNANEFRTPSVVHIGAEGCWVGTALEELLDEQPELDHARFFKLRMAKGGDFYIDHRGRSWLPQALSAVVLKKMLTDVETFAQEEIGGAVLTVPANFNDAQRRVTRESALMAGITRVKLVDEPVAAATFYGYGHKGGEQTLFVYDLGGGTFDATVLQVEHDGLYVLATEGSNRHGGKWLDDIIIKTIVDEFKRQFGIEPTDPASQMTLRRFAEDAKLNLVKPGKTKINKTLVLAGHALDFILTKDRFNQLISECIDETLQVCNSCLKKAGLDWSFIDRILLVGGSSLLPLVAEKLSFASRKPQDQLVCKQPHQAVAYGAAILAQQLFGGVDKKKLQTVSAYDLGIRVQSADGTPAVKVLVARNLPLPSQSSHRFHTTRDDQKRLIIEVVQTRTQDNNEQQISLGYFGFEIADPRKGYPVEIELAYDVEGIVVVTAKDPDTGKYLTQVFDEENRALSEAVQMQKQWIDQLVINR